jgi:pyruvate/2-oxoglutarate dehydrogenase complex dihydrolipoamide acyltransferase (E2) component
LVAARNLAFRAPELAPDALADDATERFAVGALLWTISVGRAPLLPFAGRAEALVRRVGGVPALRAHRADLPGALYDLVDSWTAEDPGRRTVHPELLAPPRAPSPAPARPTPARPRGTSRPSGAPPRPGPDALTGELRRILSLIDGRRADLGPAMATLLRAAALDLEGVVADVRVDRATLAALGAREASARTNDGAVAVAAAEQALADESAAVDRRYDEALAATRRLQADLVEALSNSAAITRAIERMLADLDHARAAIAEIDALDGPARRP